MTQYIDKTSVLAEIEKLQDSTMDEDGNFYSAKAQAEYDILCVLENSIDNIEVKEVEEELLDNALDFIVETQESNDYICEQMIDMLPNDYCANNCKNLNKKCVELFLQNVYKK